MTVHWNKQDVEQGLIAISEVRGNALTVLKQILDCYHGENRSERYYEILCGSWLELFLHLCYSTWLDAEREETRHLSKTHGLALGIAETPTEFTNWLTDDPRFRTALSAIASQQGTDGSTLAQRVQNGEIKRIKVTETGSKFKKILKSVLKTVLKKVASDTRDVIVCKPYQRSSNIEYLNAAWSLRNIAEFNDFDFPLEIAAELDIEWRIEQASQSKESGFRQIVEKLLPLQIPVIYLEGYEACRKQCFDNDIKRPRAIYTANALHYHLSFQFLAADWVERGTKLLCHQHGGGYGVDLKHAQEEFEVRVSDRFYTWGWGGNQHGSVQPLSAPNFRLGRQKKQYILLNCVAYPLHVLRVHFQPMPGRIESLVGDTVSFTTNLKNSLDLLVRPYFQDYGIGMEQAIRTASPIVQFDEERPNSLTRFAQSKLVVHNYLGTSYLETLYLNVPTICFYDPEIYDFRKEAKPLIQALENAGVIHRSGASAAFFVNKMDGNIDVWWESNHVQSARRMFVDKYAKFSMAWVEQWREEFMTVLSD